MTFSKEDKKEYAEFLEAQIKKERSKEETIFTNFNIDNLYKDLNNIKKQLN